MGSSATARPTLLFGGVRCDRAFAVIVSRLMRMASRRSSSARPSAMLRRPRASNIAVSASVATSAKNALILALILHRGGISSRATRILLSSIIAR
jgi:hypothetical protein